MPTDKSPTPRMARILLAATILRLCLVYIETPHAHKQVVDMKNALGGWLYLFPGTSRRPTTFHLLPRQLVGESLRIKQLPAG